MGKEVYMLRLALERRTKQMSSSCLVRSIKIYYMNIQCLCEVAVEQRVNIMLNQSYDGSLLPVRIRISVFRWRLGMWTDTNMGRIKVEWV